MRGRLTAAQYIDGVLSGDRVSLARAITLVESDLPRDRKLAQSVLDAVLPHSGRSQRVGITGVPGAGKSTFIDALGFYLIRNNDEKVAVLSVDPSSTLSGGSILGDKTRMQRLAAEENAFIRPSPSRGHLGGVARHTREAILLCEAAGYQTVFVETVGVGQSETAVRSMTDFFLLLMIPGAGDELQGMKRGIIEMLDGMVVNKADGDNKTRAERARTEYGNALHLFAPSPDGWVPRVLTCSAIQNEGIAEVWQLINDHRKQQTESGHFDLRRRRQALEWMRELVSTELNRLFECNESVRALLPELERAVEQGTMSCLSAAQHLLFTFRETIAAQS